MPNCPRADSRTAGRRAAASRAARARDARQHLRVLSWQATGALWRGDRCRTYGEIGVETRVGGPRARGCHASGLAGEFARVPRGRSVQSRVAGGEKYLSRTRLGTGGRACFFVASEIVSLVFSHQPRGWSQRLLRCRPALSRHFRARRGERGHPAMPAPPFLVGLSAGASVAAVVRAVAETRGDGAAEANARGESKAS